MKKELNNLSMMQEEIEKLLVAGEKVSKLGQELNKSLSKMLIPYENLKISMPKICKIDMSCVSTKTGANYQGVDIRINENLEFIPIWNIRLVIDDDH